MEEMKAGSELNHIIATEVMGFEYLAPGTYTKNVSGHSTGIPCAVEGYTKNGVFQFHEARPYSTSIEAAWEVVEKFKQEGGGWHLDYAGMGCRAALVTQSGIGFEEVAETPPLAICLAALKAAEK